MIDMVVREERGVHIRILILIIIYIYNGNEGVVNKREVPVGLEITAGGTVALHF